VRKTGAPYRANTFSSALARRMQSSRRDTQDCRPNRLFPACAATSRRVEPD
jgi:hypothetical protein